MLGHIIVNPQVKNKIHLGNTHPYLQLEQKGTGNWSLPPKPSFHLAKLEAPKIMVVPVLAEE